MPSEFASRRGNGAWLSAHFGDLELLLDASRESLEEVDDVGPIVVPISSAFLRETEIDH